MTFISYAQNFEDVMLWRALKHVESGFYIDVGANDPSVESVTKAFYESGWNGINIEPIPLHCSNLREQRERDTTLQCAVGAESGEIEIWECDVRGWATASLDVVTEHIAAGHEGSYRKVTICRLTEICEEYVQGDIHFLKIDVEGTEESVIRGMDFSRFRPWILVIESTKPNSKQEIHDKWESIILDAEYLIAYCDGLNRFYVASEHSELLDNLRYPPNVFDEFIRTEQLQSELRAAAAETRNADTEAKAEEAEAKAEEAEAKAEEAEAKAEGAEAKAEEAEAKAEEAEAKAEEAEAKAEEAEAKAEEAEAKAEEAEAKAEEAKAKAEEAETKAEEAETKAEEAETKAEEAEANAEEAEAALIAIYNSSSWRLTAPLRKIVTFTRNARHFPKTLKAKSKDKSKLLLAHAKLYINRRPKLKHLVFVVLVRFPALEKRIRPATIAAPSPQPAQPPVAAELENLTPRARQIYVDLKAAIAKQQKEND